jgi:hypothetical protein
MAMLPARLDIGTNLGVEVDACRSGYVAWKSAKTPIVLTSKCSRTPDKGTVRPVLKYLLIPMPQMSSEA